MLFLESPGLCLYSSDILSKRLTIHHILVPQWHQHSKTLNRKEHLDMAAEQLRFRSATSQALTIFCHFSGNGTISICQAVRGYKTKLVAIHSKILVTDVILHELHQGTQVFQQAVLKHHNLTHACPFLMKSSLMIRNLFMSVTFKHLNIWEFIVLVSPRLHVSVSLTE